MQDILPSEIAAIVDCIDPDAYAAGATNGGWVDAKNYHKFMAVVMAGTLGASATLDFKLQQATDSSGTGAKDISGAAITQLTKAGSDDDKQAIINVRNENLDVENGFNHVRMVMTVATATSDCGAVLLGFGGREGPASANDAASVAEIVTT